MVSKYKYSVSTSKDFNSSVDSVICETEKAGFRVLHVHDIRENLLAKGFKIEPIKIIEICSAKYAYQLVQKDISFALMLPCKISVHQRNGKVTISTLRPVILRKIFSNIDQTKLINEVDIKIKTIVECSK